MTRRTTKTAVSTAILLIVLGTGGFAGCYDEDSGPRVDPYQPESNECLQLLSGGLGEDMTPEDLLSAFDCLNSEGAFDAVRAPLGYVIDTGYLDPYFDVPGYLDPIDLSPYIEAGDPVTSIQGFNRVINDPDEPIQALLDLYVELYEADHIEASLRLGHAYAAFLYEGCLEDFRSCYFSVLADMAYDLLNDEQAETLREFNAEKAGAMDPRIAEDIAYDMASILRSSVSEWSETGRNLIFDLVAAFAIDPLDGSRYAEATLPAFVEEDWTLLQALQQPICQLRSNRAVVDALFEGAGATAADEGLYLALNLKTLANYGPGGVPATKSRPGDVDHDKDGVSIREGDCDDSDNTVYPGALEVNDRKDNDCNLVADDAVLSTDDLDGDQVSPNQGDCDDTDASVHPGISISLENGSLIVVDPGEELLESQLGDLKDNDCDGYVDYHASSLEILLGALQLLLPQLYAISDEDTGATTLDVLVETMADSSGTTLDPIALLEDNEDLVADTISNLSNDLIPPELTVQFRNLLPVIYQLDDLGMLSTSSNSSAVLTAIYEDHVAFQEMLQNADDSTQRKIEEYGNTCGEANEQYIDALKVLDDLLMILDAYQVLQEPNLNTLLPIVINSDLLDDSAKAEADNPLAPTEEILEAQLHMFDYFIRPHPDEPGVYEDHYESARLWWLVPLLELLYEDPARLEEIDALMIYLFEGMDDSSSVPYAVPEALDALSYIGGGGSVDQEGVLNELLKPEARAIIVNILAIPADPLLAAIVLGDWGSLSEPQRTSYETEESILEYSVRLIEDGTVNWFLGMAAELAEWLVENTPVGETAEDGSSSEAGLDGEGTPTPVPTDLTPTP